MLRLLFSDVKAKSVDITPGSALVCCHMYSGFCSLPELGYKNRGSSMIDQKKPNEQNISFFAFVPAQAWMFAIILFCVFAVLCAFVVGYFHHANMADFIAAEVDTFLTLLKVAGVLISLVAVAGTVHYGYKTYHNGVLEKHQRKLAHITVQKQEEKLKQEQAKTVMYQAVPALLKYTVDSGHNFKGYGVEITSYLSNVHTIPALEAKPDLQQIAAPVKSFYELLTDGTVQSAIREEKMLLGYTQGVIRHGSWLDLYSCGIGGVSGSGKTTTVRFLLFQAVLAGAKLVMVDPHIENIEESLAAQFTCFTNTHLFKPCGDTPSLILQRVQALKKELASRKRTGRKTPFVILVIDEFNAVMRDKQVREEVAELLVSIAQEGRKFGLFAMLIGQRWASQDIGGADIRTSLASTLAHRFTDENQAGLLVGGRNAPKCLELPQGNFLFRDTNGVLSSMTTPNTVVDDGPYIQHLLRISPETSIRNQPESSVKPVESRSLTVVQRGDLTLVKPDRNLLESSVESSSESPSNEALDLLAIRIIQMQAQGMNKGEIIKALWGVAPGASDRYNQAQEAYQQAMQYMSDKLGA